MTHTIMTHYLPEDKTNFEYLARLTLPQSTLDKTKNDYVIMTS